MNGMKNNLLTIIIPTYNRYRFLDYSLSVLSKYNKKYMFTLIVCDNASDDATSEIIRKWEKEFYFFKYIRQAENIGYAKNVTAGYMAVETDYCWVLGDSYSFSEGTLKLIYQELESQHPNAIIVNSKRNFLAGKEQAYSQVDDLLSTIGWSLTLLCSCIISKDFIRQEAIKRYTDTRFLHFGIFIDYLCFCDTFKVLCIKDAKVRNISLGVKKSPKGRLSWQHAPFKVFGEGWFMFVMSLPNTISLSTKLKCISDHDMNTNFFHPLRIIIWRLEGYISYSDYFECRKYMRWITQHPVWIYDLIYLCPPLSDRLVRYIGEKRKIKEMRVIIRRGIRYLNSKKKQEHA